MNSKTKISLLALSILLFCQAAPAHNSVVVIPLGGEVAEAPASFKRIFLTDEVYQGNFGGFSQADSFCQAEANAHNIDGIFKAHLTNHNQRNIPRNDINYSSLPIANLKGEVIFGSTALFLYEFHLYGSSSPFIYTPSEFSTTIPADIDRTHGYWTGYDHTNFSMDDNNAADCNLWTEFDSSSVGSVGQYEYSASSGFVTAATLNHHLNDVICSAERSFLCMEQ